MENTKPITFVTSYRGARGYPNGLYEGKTRDVVIAGVSIPDAWEKGGQHTVLSEVAHRAYDYSGKVMQDFLPRIDEMIVYLGKDGAGAAFHHVRDLMKQNGKRKIRMVACDCGYDSKRKFLTRHNLGVIWSECGGRTTLADMVKRRLE